MNCTQCGAALEEGTTACPTCGAEQSGGPTPAVPSGGPTAAVPGGGPTVAASSAPATSGGQTGQGARPVTPVSFDARRLSQTDRIVGVATLVLFISLFLPWFGVNFGFGSVTVDGLWHGYEYITLLLSIAVVLYLLARALWATLPIKLAVPHEQLLAGAALVNLVLVVIGFVLKPGGSAVGWRFGAFVSLIAAIVAFAPKLVPSLQARVAKRRS